MDILAIIPARGGSQRLPRKNVLPVAGQPLVTHTIRHALEAQRVSRTVVSTDDAEIASVSRQAGAEVIVRPSELAAESSTSESALQHVLQHLLKTEGYSPELVVFLQCTSPFRRRHDIDDAVRTLLDAGADSVFSATASKWFLWRSAGPWAESFNYDHRQRRREQEMAPEWRENGSIYVFKPWVLAQEGNRLGGKIAVYEMDYWSSFQIDSMEDLDLCGWILERQGARRRKDALPARVGAVVFDFDGVFTDNRVLVAQDGSESVACNRADGLGLDHLRSTGVPILVLSTEINPVVGARCRKVKVEFRQGLEDKAQTLRQFMTERGIPLSDVIYVGNDANDLDCLKAVGCAIVVADADPSVKNVAHVILDREGGRGAVREVCDLVIDKLRGD